ncbi:glycosyltransferase [Aliiglaciecola lipolytica]|uniref:glycosyltransferase n=1 Tax=Aliiglaciecola lipolytica TaxID=477689 RepID=UPI001C09C367|nr:glycosyltransferase [Aliiglaciecola lipolytica]
MIEDFTAGFLSGWYFNNTPSSESSSFQIEINGKVIGTGEASLFRQDLKDAGFTDGCHAFRVFIDDKITEYGELSIRLCSETGDKVEGNSFLFERTEPTFEMDLKFKDSFNFIFNVQSDQAYPNLRLQLNAGNKLVYFQHLNVITGNNQVSVSIPTELLDGIERLYTIGLEGSSNALWQGHAKFSPIITPREHLKNPHKATRLISDCAQAAFRYESLKLWFDEKLDLATLNNIHNAHSVLCEGWNNRKEYPKLSLPKFDKPLVSIIIPAYNKFELTYHCIASLILAYNKTPFEVILADDCSTDETEEAEIYIENLIVSRNEKNLMFLRNCNKAAEICQGEYLLFLNNDTEVTSCWLDELIEVISSNDDCGIVGSKLLNEDGTLQEAGGIVWASCNPWNVGNGDNPNKPEYNYMRHADYLSGASLCIRRDIWDKVEGFSDYLAPAYFEDTDIAFKVREAGYSTLYVPSSEVFHFEGMTNGRDLNSGVKKNQVVNFNKFAKRWSSEVRYNGQASIENLQIEKDRNIQKRILVIDYTAPDPSRDAGSYAAIQEIKLMQSLGFKVTFTTDNLAHLGELTTKLQKMGVEVLYAPFYISIDSMLAKRLKEMDAVYITRYYVAQSFVDRIKSLQPSIPILFNNADLHFLRELRSAKSDEDRSKAIKTREDELNICKKVDAILCYNNTEHAVIASHILEQGNFHITPWVLESKTAGPSFEEREGIAFLGGYGHQPNVEAVEYLVEKIMPLLLTSRPDIKLYVYGSKMPKSFDDYECENIEIVGFAKSLDDVFHKHRVFVAPLLSGSGIKGKVLEAMAYQVPCVLSDVAAEGTGLTNGLNTLIAKEPQEWVDEIIKLYDDQKLWQSFAENSQLLAKENYSFEHGVKQFKTIFESVGIYSCR